MPGRCLAAGKEIKEKMMDKNGFTAGETMIFTIVFIVLRCS
jgi:hypothetical protein